MSQSKTRSEYGEEKKIQRLISDMDEFLGVLPKFLGNDILVKEQSNGRASTKIKDDEKSIAKMEFKSALFRVKETKEELEQLHKISEEEVSFWFEVFSGPMCITLTDSNSVEPLAMFLNIVAQGETAWKHATW